MQAKQFALRASGIRRGAISVDAEENDGTVLTTNDGSLFVSGSVSHEAATNNGAISGSVAVLGTTTSGVSGLALSDVAYDEQAREVSMKFAGVVGSNPIEQAVRLKLNDSSAAFVPSSDFTSANSTVAGLPSPLCIIGCGGASILPLVVSNLPTLIAGGPGAFIAALLASAPSTLVGVINCIRTKCL